MQAPAPACLIVNADDYGYRDGVSLGIIDTARNGIVTATGVLANAQGLSQQVHWLTKVPALDVGVHLNLTHGTPLSDIMRNVVGEHFPASSTMIAALVRNKLSLDVVTAEWRAQIDQCLSLGITIRFLNSHEHLHMLPRPYLLTRKLAEEYAIGHIRHTRTEWLGQMTLIMVGLMMIALLDLHQENWWRSALWLVLAFALKPLAAILILLVAVLYPRSIIPLLTSFAAFVVIPFGLKDPAYVWSQYQDSVFTMQQVAAFGRDNPFAQIFWMLREAGVDVSDTMRFVLRLLFASGTLGLCWWLQRRQSRATFLVYLFALSTCYVLLFNPRTENNTYAILAPAIGVFVAWSFYTRTGLLRYDHAAISTGYLLSNRIGKWLTGFATVWIKPLLCCVFLVLIIYQSINEDDPRKIATDN